MQPHSREDYNTESSQVQSVNATPAGLLKATIGAAVVASAILTFVWLPAEYGIDPTGVGHVLGLTEMGHIKEQLHAEADADAANTTAGLSTNALSTSAEEKLNQRLDAIQAQLTTITAALKATPQIDTIQAVAPPVTSDQQDDNSVPSSSWLDELEYTLAPGEGMEIKLVMAEGAVADFYWNANGSVLNYDTHGDGNGESISYEKGRSVPRQAGQLTASFEGNHGWFWRNRTDEDVVLTLRTKGDYTGMVLP